MKILFKPANQTICIEISPEELHTITQNVHGDLRRDFSVIHDQARRAFALVSLGLEASRRKYG